VEPSGRHETKTAQRPFLPFLLSFSTHFRRNPGPGHAFGQSRCAPRRAANGPASRPRFPGVVLRLRLDTFFTFQRAHGLDAARSHFYRGRGEKSAKKSAGVR